ncbi:serine protease [Aerosakkonema sp. BLCC-F183]|uniref:S1 family peptidase n=1 Tax=Aerosakkonema sp. BLCC-F183 TaxID=3342834 RepID=UPI0035B73315
MNFCARLSMVFLSAGIAVLQAQLVMGLTTAQIREKAAAITVRIDGPNNGSGVIVEKEGSNPICYTVLTNWHVVERQGNYIVEIRGDRYIVNSSQIRRIQGVDLAVLGFQTEYNGYPKAALGDSVPVGQSDRVYVAGWADKDGISLQRRFMFVDGSIRDVLPGPREGGYTLRYTNLTQPGMSGGPVLNDQGIVIGINGSGKYGEIGFLGIPINIFSVWDRQYGRSPCGISSSAPPPRPELTGFPKQTCGGSNPPGLQTWYPVFVNYSEQRLRQIQSRFCRDAFPNDKRDPNRTYIQVVSFQNRAIAEAFAQLMKKEFGSGEVGEAYSR